jgi:murein DD-endopeptidase MepM/ murein hydrolase activator NlpD
MPRLIFPLPHLPKNFYWMPHQQTAFGEDRDNGRRKHAGVDLEAPAGTPVLAMADGVVLRVARYFFDGTSAVEVQHQGVGIILRYGELEHLTIRVSEGQYVKQGEIIGYVGRRSHATRFMLHLELFLNWSDALVTPGKRNAHPLTDTTKPPFERRADLHNPTAILMSAPTQQVGAFASPSVADAAAAGEDRKAAHAKHSCDATDRQAEVNRNRLILILHSASLIKTTSFGRTNR